MSVGDGITAVAILKGTDNMQADVASVRNKHNSGFLDDASLTNLTMTGEVEIAGRHYGTRSQLAAILGRAPRTLARWDAARIGPPKI